MSTLIQTKEASLEDLCKPIESVHITQITDANFTFLARLRFSNKKDARTVFSPCVVCTWDIQLLPLLRNLTHVHLPRPPGHY